MRVDGFSAPSDVSGSSDVGQLSPDQQMIEALKVPVQAHDHKAAHARLDAVKQIIGSLTPDDAKAIFDRVKNLNKNDELSVLFNSQFGDQNTELLKTLLKKQFADAPTTESETKPQDPSKAEKRSDVDRVGQKRADDLSKEIKSRIDSDGVTDPGKVASEKKYSPAEKKAFYKDYLTKATNDDLQKLLKDSEKWEPAQRQLLDNVLASSPEFTKKAAKAATAGQHTAILDRIIAAKPNDSLIVIDGFIKNLDGPALNDVALNLSKLKNMPGSEFDGMNIMASIANRSSELTRDARLALTEQAMSFEYLGHDHPGTLASRAHTLNSIFEKSTPDQKNQLFDDLQDTGKIDDLARSLKELGEINVNVLKGMSPDNLDFFRDALRQSQREAVQAGNKNDINVYDRMILQIDGYMQNHFPDYKKK